MAGVQMDPKKWNMPGWKIEQKFRPGVLMGNWDEERRNFTKGDHIHNSTQRTDFVRFPSYQPDVISRRKAELNIRGLPAELLLHHHGRKYNNQVTWYDEDFNGRWREKDLPALRKWNGHFLKWEPEKSDFHVQEPPTNFGLLSQLQTVWARQRVDQNSGTYLTTYTLSYQPHFHRHPASPRYATPIWDSSIVHPVNKTLKDLHLRNTPIFKCPELMPAEMAYVSV